MDDRAGHVVAAIQLRRAPFTDPEIPPANLLAHRERKNLKSLSRRLAGIVGNPGTLPPLSLLNGERFEDAFMSSALKRAAPLARLQFTERAKLSRAWEQELRRGSGRSAENRQAPEAVWRIIILLRC